MLLQSRGFISLLDKSNTFYISTCTRPTATKHGKVVTYHEWVPHIKSHNPFKKVVTWSHVTNLNNYTPTLSWFRTTKLGRVLTSGRSFSMQTPKSSPNSSFHKFLCIKLFLQFSVVSIVKRYFLIWNSLLCAKFYVKTLSRNAFSWNAYLGAVYMRKWETGWDKKRDETISIQPSEDVYIRNGTEWKTWWDEFYSAFKEKSRLDISRLEKRNKKISPLTKFAQ